MTSGEQRWEGLATGDTAGRRLIALDIDGTLLSYGGGLSDAVRAVVADLIDAGHHVVLASGRSLVAMLPVAAELGIDRGYLVCSNGAVTVRLDPARAQGYELVDVVTFDPGPALRLLRERLPEARYAVEEVGVGFRLSEPFPPGELGGDHRVVGFEDLWVGEVTRVVVRAPEGTREDLHEMAREIGLDDVTYAIGYTAWMDIAPLGVTKATALEQVRLVVGVAAGRTVAIGDGHNDIDMLEWAARGVAMGHSPQAVVAAADEVTGTIQDDGAVPVLRGLLP